MLRGKFLIGDEIFFWGGVDYFIFPARSNGAALLCAGFFLFGKMKTSATGYLCSEDSARARRGEGRAGFSASLLSDGQKWPSDSANGVRVWRRRRSEAPSLLCRRVRRKSFFCANALKTFVLFQFIKRIDVRSGRCWCSRGVWSQC